MAEIRSVEGAHCPQPFRRIPGLKCQVLQETPMNHLPLLPEIQRLPEPYRDENALRGRALVAAAECACACRPGRRCIVQLASSLGGPGARTTRRPFGPWRVPAARVPHHPPGRPGPDATGRGALLRVPDAETAIALTADQLGRADFDAAGDGPHKMLSSLSAAAISLSKKFLPSEDSTGQSAGGLAGPHGQQDRGRGHGTRHPIAGAPIRARPQY